MDQESSFSDHREGGGALLGAALPHATVPIGRHGVEVHLIKVFCVGQLAVRSELPERENDDFREAVTTFEENERTARRVFGGEHPLTTQIKYALRKARAALRARETPPPPPPAPLYDEDELD